MGIVIKSQYPLAVSLCWDQQIALFLKNVLPTHLLVLSYISYWPKLTRSGWVCAFCTHYKEILFGPQASSSFLSHIYGHQSHRLSFLRTFVNQGDRQFWALHLLWISPHMFFSWSCFFSPSPVSYTPLKITVCKIGTLEKQNDTWGKVDAEKAIVHNFSKSHK